MKLLPHQVKYAQGYPDKGFLVHEGGCFAKGTLVLTKKGYKPIEKIKKNELLASFNGEKISWNKVYIHHKTSNKPKPMIQFKYGKATITSTYDHPFYNGKKYYPLYQLVWRKMEASQRIQLKLLCEQYGTPFNYQTIRGITHKDSNHETRGRSFRSFKNSYEQKDNKSSPCCCSNMVKESTKTTLHKSQRLRPIKQQHKQSGMVYCKTKLATCLQKWSSLRIFKKSSEKKSKIQRRNIKRDKKILRHEYYRSKKNKHLFKKQNIQRIKEKIPLYSSKNSVGYKCESKKLSSIRIKKAEPYWSIGVENTHTYIVSKEQLPVHNTGKTICACVWLRDGRDSDALVICPKKVIRKWQKALSEWDTKATVVSTDAIKEMPIKRWSAVVVDEADEFASPLFIAKLRSGRTTALYDLVKAHQEMPLLLLTATPIRSTPWNLHTLLAFYGKYIDWKLWREYFFYLQYPDDARYRFLSRPAFMPKDGWQELIQSTLKKYADIVLLNECVEYLPPVTSENIEVKTPKFIRLPDSKPFFDEHRHEQQNKAKVIVQESKEYRKVLVVAYYREQIEDLEKKLSKHRETFAVHGGVKNQEEILEKAQASSECYLIVQSDIGAGFDADTFSLIIFASMSYAIRSYVQMKYRVRRIHNLKPVKYTYLLGGRCDKAILNSIEKGKSFVPSEWIKTYEPTNVT